MRIASFWAKGYRSLRDVRVDDLGAFNVFYGPNGSGKSNLLEGLRALFDLVTVIAATEILEVTSAASSAVSAGLVRKGDICAHDPSRVIVLGARLVGLPTENLMLTLTGLSPATELVLEVTFDLTLEHQPKLALSMLESRGKDLRFLWSQPQSPPAPQRERHEWTQRRDRMRAMLIALSTDAYTLVSAYRQPRYEKTAAPPEEEDVVAWHLREGRLKSALLAAQLSPSHEVRRKLAAFRGLLAGEPLHRPPFAPVQDPRTGEIDLRELLPEPNPEGRDISIDLAGLGIAQIYAILAETMLLRASSVGIEEPEAHLHAPTSGRALRQLLVRLVEERHIDQLFIATHSNLFDLDPAGYYDVSLEDGCTVVERAELTRIDREHLYEPGPAKRALEHLLQYAPEDEVVFRRPDGAGVTAKEMLRLLQEDDAVALHFLQDVHGAAVRMVKVQAKKRQAG
ncbi:AAA family ATPase [Sorangium sp. So ce1389]|uniref:AAA family ATPase n=1 Tax=Sorangium sp. So ce1389 TaxID=3133336 RepID=UPI003F6299E3